MAASAYVTELTTSGTSRRVHLKLTVYAADGFTGRRDASYSVTCPQAGVSERFPMYSGFWVSGEESTIFDKTFEIYLPNGESEAAISLSFSVSMYSSAAGGNVSITGSISKLYLTADSNPEPDSIPPSNMILYQTEVTLGQVLSIYIFPNSTSCYHDLSLYVKGVNRGLIAGGVYTSYDWKVTDLSLMFTGSTLEVTIRCDTYTPGGSHMGYTEKAVTLRLPPATVPQCASSGAMGTTLKITLPRGLPSYTHQLRYSFSGTTGLIAAVAETEHQWQIPLALAKVIPTLQKASCAILCQTIHNGMSLGTEEISITLTVPDNDTTKPKASMTLSPSGDLPAAFVDMYIQGKTGIRAQFDASSEYSTIFDYSLVVEGTSAKGNPAISQPLRGYGSITVTGRVTDARGYVRELKQTITAAAYEKPRVVPYPGESTVVAVRCDADGTRNPLGESLLIKAGRKFTPLGVNRCTLQYRIRHAESYGDYQDLLTAQAAGDYVFLTIPGSLPDVKNGYSVQLRAMDTLGSYTVLTVPIGAAVVPLHIGQGNGNVAIGKYCDYSRENALEIGLTAYFDTGAALRRIFDGGTWQVGTELGSSVSDAEVSTVGRYSLFIASSGGNPVLLARLGEKLSGSGIAMTYTEGTLTLEAAPNPVTALYAVL